MYSYDKLLSNALRLAVNKRTEIAKRIMPKNLRKRYMAAGEITFSTFSVAFSTINTNIMLSKRAINMFTVAYSARSESSVVNEPAPANSGNTTGMRVADLIGPMFLKITTSSIISSDMRKITSEPATANDSMSTLNKCNMASPAKKNPSSKPNEISVAFHAFTGRP